MVPLLAHFQKRSLFSLQFGYTREYILKLNWKKSNLLIYFENWLVAPCSHRQSRNRMMNTFIIVNIDSLENKSMLLVHFKKAFPLTLLGHSFDRRAAYWLLLPRYCLFLHRQIRQRIVKTLLMSTINPTCNKLFIFICQEKIRNLACISNELVINC